MLERNNYFKIVVSTEVLLSILQPTVFHDLSYSSQSRIVWTWTGKWSFSPSLLFFFILIILFMHFVSMIGVKWRINYCSAKKGLVYSIRRKHRIKLVIKSDHRYLHIKLSEITKFLLCLIQKAIPWTTEKKYWIYCSTEVRGVHIIILCATDGYH